MDIAFLVWLQQFRTPVLDKVFWLITQFGEQSLLIALICAIYWCVEKRLAVYMIFNFFVGGALCQALKIGVCVPRPWVRDPRVVPVPIARAGASGYSFPSGHTAAATAAYGSLAIYMNRRWVRWACGALILLVAFSRLYLGVHTPQDVVASLIIGIPLLWVTNRLFAWMGRSARADVWVLLIGLALSAALVAFTAYKPYPSPDSRPLALDTYKTAGASVGMFIGWFWERRAIRFDTRAALPRQLLKFVLGLALVLAIMVIPWPFSLLTDEMGALARYALLAFTAMGLWPFLFKRLLGRAAK